MKPGESFEWRRQELFAVATEYAACNLNNTKCKFADFTKAKCLAPDNAPECGKLIFVTKQQYLELRLLGET